MLVNGRNAGVADQHAAPRWSGNPCRKDEFDRRYSDRVLCPISRPAKSLSKRSGGRAATRLSAPPGLPSVAISVGTTSMIAIPVAAFMGPVAMIVGPAPQIRCNDFGHGRPMIAIPAADDCGSLQVATPLSRRQIDHPSPLNADSTRRRRCVFLLCVPRRTCWFSSGSALGTA